MEPFIPLREPGSIPYGTPESLDSITQETRKIPKPYEQNR